MVTVSGERSSDIAAEAAEWHLDLQAGTPSAEQRADFAEWLSRSPLHVEEFLRAVVLQADTRALPEVHGVDVEALLERVRSDAARNVIDFPLNPKAARSEPAAPHIPVTWWRRPAAAVAAAAMLLTVGLWQMWPAQQRALHYATGDGEQRAVRLQDGSQLRINVHSQVDVHIDAASRDIQLPAGEALFEVARDPAHPFRVHTPQAVIEAKGTRFDVRVRNGRTVVVLLEGHVEVAPPGVRTTRNAATPALTPVMLAPGEAVTVSPDARETLHPKAADVDAATAWLQYRLVFEDTRLSRVIEEFSMYSSERIVIDDPSIGDLRVTASFNAGDAGVFARSVGAAAALRATRAPDGTWHLDRP